MDICREDGCEEPKQARGLCKRHYAAWYRRTHPEQIAAYVEKDREDRREYRRDYYLANRDKILARQQEMRDADREGYNRRNLARATLWAQENPEKARTNRRRHWAKKKYGLTLEEYEAILARGCAICGIEEDPDRDNRRRGRLCLDHDHTSGQIRDALCKDCNVGLGSFMDDPARLRAAARYLETHRPKGGDVL